MKENNKNINYLLNTKKPYILEIDNMKVEMTYMDNNKKFKDCMLDILKQKYENG